MSELHAVTALDQLAVFDDLLERRAGAARVYARAVDGFSRVGLQHVRAGDHHSHVHWALRVPGAIRPAFRAELAELGIGTRDYFQALHRTGWHCDRLLPATSRLHEEVVAVPMSSELTTDDAEGVALGLEYALRHALARLDERPAGFAEDVLTHPVALERARTAADIRARRGSAR